LGLIVWSLSVATLRQALLDSAGERLAVAAADVAEKLDRTLFERYGDITLMAHAAALQGRDSGAMTAYLRRVQETYYYYEWIGVADAGGTIVASTDPSAIGRDQSAATWFRQAAGAGATVAVQDAHRSAEAGGTLVVSFAAPLTDAGGTFRGVVVSQVALPVLEDLIGSTVTALLAQQGTTARVEYQLLRADGELIADSILREEGRANLKTLGVQSALLTAGGPTGFVEEMHERRQVPVITGYAKSKGFEGFTGLKWMILVRMDKDDVEAPITALLWRIGLIGGIGLLPLLGLFLWTVARLKTEWSAVVWERDRALVAESSLEERTQALKELVEVGRQLSAQTDSEALLRQIVEAAQRLCRARYAALGIFDKTGRLTSFMTLGIEESHRQMIGALPTGRGLLGRLAHEGVLRLKDLTQHPAFKGFPAHHPPMRSFLGAPIYVREHVYGRLYLTDKQGSAQASPSEFTELDEQVVMALAAHAGVAIEKSVTFQKLREAGEELRQANASLQEATREVEDMTSIVAHDLKAPLVTIQGYAGRLSMIYASQMDDKSRRYVTTIRDVSKVLGQMVEGLLEVSRIHRRTFQPRRCEMLKTVEQVCAGLSESIASVGAKVTLEFDPACPHVKVDPVAFHEILQNLLSNALKFGAPGMAPDIRIGSRLQAAEVLVWVKDNGIGIPADRQAVVFQIFRKLNKQTPGVGVGLAAVKKLVAQCGGRVWIESTEGKGTAVFFSLPTTEH
jgi:signal transduction histidine kinase